MHTSSADSIWTVSFWRCLDFFSNSPVVPSLDSFFFFVFVLLFRSVLPRTKKWIEIENKNIYEIIKIFIFVYFLIHFSFIIIYYLQYSMCVCVCAFLFACSFQVHERQPNIRNKTNFSWTISVNNTKDDIFYVRLSKFMKFKTKRIKIIIIFSIKFGILFLYLIWYFVWNGFVCMISWKWCFRLDQWHWFLFWFIFYFHSIDSHAIL